jgi:hypothetical protein
MKSSSTSLNFLYQLLLRKAKNHIRSVAVVVPNSNSTIGTRFLGCERAAITCINHRFQNIIKEVAIKVYGDAITNVSSDGIAPMYSYFNKLLGLPSVA